MNLTTKLIPFEEKTFNVDLTGKELNYIFGAVSGSTTNQLRESLKVEGIEMEADANSFYEVYSALKEIIEDAE